VGDLADVRRLVLNARKKGISMRVADGQLVMSGPCNAEIVSKLREHKIDILAMLHNATSNLDEIVRRLRKGQQTLIAMQDRLWDPDGNPIGSERAVGLFVSAMCTWDVLEMMLQGHPLYGAGCPIGPDGCDADSPVLCDSCAT